MKKVYIEIDEITDCTEFYNSKPHPFFKITVILLFSLLIASVIWMYMSKIEIKVKGEGTIKNSKNTMYVTNLIDGEIGSCFVQDGDRVEKGELLYELEHEELDEKLSYYENKEKKLLEKNIMYEAYIKWLDGETDNLNAYAKNSFYDLFSEKCNCINEKIIQSKSEFKDKMKQYRVNENISISSVNEYRKKIERYKKVIKSIKNNKNYLSKKDIYYFTLVESYLLEYKEIMKEYKKNVNSIDETTDIKGQKENYKQEMLEKSEKLKINTLLSVEKEIKALEENITSEENKLDEINENIEVLKKSDNYQNIKENIMNNEKVSALQEQESLDNEMIELKENVKEISKKIEKSKLYAKQNGYVNFLEDRIEVGNYVYSGEKLMTIIKSGNSYFVEAYIKNCDIGLIRKGMKVKCAVDAYPHEEYGYLTGILSKISKDIKNVDEHDYAYYKVKVKLEGIVLHDSEGKEYQLKNGMSCQVKIITKKTRILKWILQKIDLIN